MFLNTLLEIEGVRRSPALISFLCLDKPPVNQGGNNNDKALCLTLEEVVKELRIQLRKVEHLEQELQGLKLQNLEKGHQIMQLKEENDLIKQQKETLMNALSSGLQN